MTRIAKLNRMKANLFEHIHRTSIAWNGVLKKVEGFAIRSNELDTFLMSTVSLSRTKPNGFIFN